MAESFGEPFVVAKKPGYLVVYKPRGLHSAPLREGEASTLLAWCAAAHPEVLLPRGRKAVEGGLLHRLDGDTAGLVLFARTQEACDELLRQQELGLFRKEYEAACSDLRSRPASAPGFPPRPAAVPAPFEIRSAFRPWGPGRKAVRPVPAEGPRPASAKEVALDRGSPYATRVLALEAGAGRAVVRAELARGFRHQVRCHLAWLGLPIVGDCLYGPPDAEGPLGLEAVALSFLDPEGGGPVRYAIPSSRTSGGNP